MGSRIKWVWDFHLLGNTYIYMHTDICAVGVTLGWAVKFTSVFHAVFFLFVKIYTEIIVYVIGRNDVKKLFEFWCEVKPTRGIDRGSISRNGGGAATPAGVIIESFPEGFRDKEVLTGIPSFAFPCDLERWVYKQTHIRTQTCDCMLVCVSGYSTFSHVYLIYTYVHIYNR